MPIVVASTGPNQLNWNIDTDPSNVVWVSVDGVTSVCGPAGTLDAVKEGGVLLFTVMKWENAGLDHHTDNRLITSESFMLRAESACERTTHTFSKSCTLTIEASVGLSNYAEIWASVQATEVSQCETALNAFYKEHSVDLTCSNNHRYIQPGMMQCDFSDGPKLYETAGLRGWSPINRLSFTPEIYWVRAVSYAVAITGCCLDTVLRHAPIIGVDSARALVVSALTAFAGNYPTVAEVLDDRSLGCMKFDTNRDCDDMAITVAAVEQYLRKRGPIRYTECKIDCDPKILQLAELLHSFLCTYYTGSAAVVCKALPKAANPLVKAESGKPSGHVFAILTRMPFNLDGSCPDMFVECDVVESTRQSTPFSASLSTANTCFKRADWKYGYSGISSMKPLLFKQYPIVISANTGKCTHIIVHPDTKTIGGSLKDLYSGLYNATHLSIPPASQEYTTMRRTAAHYPNYDMMDAACAASSWRKCMGLESSGPLTDIHRLGNWDYTGSPWSFALPGLEMSKTIVYSFVENAENDTFTSSVRDCF